MSRIRHSYSCLPRSVGVPTVAATELLLREGKRGRQLKHVLRVRIYLASLVVLLTHAHIPNFCHSPLPLCRVNRLHSPSQYASKLEAEIGFFTKFDSKHYIAGMQKNVEINLPVKAKIDVDLQHSTIDLRAEPINKDIQTTILHYSAEPYIVRHDILNLKPVQEENDYEKIEGNRGQKFETVFGEQSTGMAFSWSYESSEKQNCRSKIFNDAKNDPWMLLYYPMAEDQLKYENASLTYLPHRSSTSFVAFSLSYDINTDRVLSRRLVDAVAIGRIPLPLWSATQSDKLGSLLGAASANSRSPLLHNTATLTTHCRVDEALRQMAIPDLQGVPNSQWFARCADAFLASLISRPVECRSITTKLRLTAHPDQKQMDIILTLIESMTHSKYDVTHAEQLMEVDVNDRSHLRHKKSTRRSRQSNLEIEPIYKIDREESRQERMAALLDQVGSGLKGKSAVAVDFSVQFGGEMESTFIATAALARSLIDENSHLIISAYNKPVLENQHPLHVFLNVSTKAPNVPLINFKEALKAIPFVAVNASLYFDDTSAATGYFNAQAIFNQSEDRRQYISQHPMAQLCESQMNEGNNALPACRNVTAEANYMDQLEILLSYYNIPVSVKNATYKFYSWLHSYTYPYIDENVFEENFIQNNIRVISKLSTDLKELNVFLESPIGNAKLEDFPLGPIVGPLFAVHPVYSAPERVSRVILADQFNEQNILLQLQNYTRYSPHMRSGVLKVATFCLATTPFFAVHVCLLESGYELIHYGYSYAMMIGLHNSFITTKWNVFTLMMPKADHRNGYGRRNPWGSLSIFRCLRLAVIRQESRSMPPVQKWNYFPPIVTIFNGRMSLSAPVKIYAAKCSVGASAINTFNNNTYQIHLGNCWHVLMVIAPKQHHNVGHTSHYLPHINEENDIAVLVRDSNSPKKEVKIITGVNVIDITPDSLRYDDEETRGSVNGKVRINERSIKISSKNVTEVYNDEGYVWVKLYFMSPSSLKLRFPLHGLKMLYDRETVQLSANDSFRNAVKGLCGTFNSEPITDFTAPNGKFLNDTQLFAAIYSLPQHCQGPTTTLRRKAWQKAVVSVYEETASPNVIDLVDILGGVSLNSSSSTSEILQENTRVPTQTKHVVRSILRTTIFDEGSEVCFSLYPLPACSKGSHPSSRIEKSIPVYCLSRKNSTAKKLEAMIENGLNPDLRIKGATKYLKVSLPKSCVKN
ncbi:hypothetical protein PR048_012775 [Dryococelus australis]|uniref:VWFD domain-containing protein n=1 Tax=Dryococelus australis TaxID=614101 RepID=A0ABQ9HQB6_9NEOP|nr:hypothetical protein PR048_012775 [Dryococelus australis]